MVWDQNRRPLLLAFRKTRLTLQWHEGLASNSIYELLEDRRGTSDQRSQWHLRDQPAGASRNRAEDPSHPLSLTLYGISHGLETTQMYGAEKPGGVVTSQGEVWFASRQRPGPRLFEFNSARGSGAGSDRLRAGGRQPAQDRRKFLSLPTTPRSKCTTASFSFARRSR